MSVRRHRQAWQLNPESLHGQLIRVGSLSRPDTRPNVPRKMLAVFGWRELNLRSKSLNEQVTLAYVGDHVLIVDHASVANNLFFLCLNARMDLCWTYADEL